MGNDMINAATETNSQRVKVHLFAAARDLIGQETVEITIPYGAIVFDARNSLVRAYPALEKLADYLHFVVGNEYARDADKIPDDCDLSVFPPVSGG